MNKTILMGRLTKDPEVKYFQNENSTANILAGKNSKRNIRKNLADIIVRKES